MTGGDVCEPWVIEQLTRQGKLYNLYGPTEATVLITARQLRSRRQQSHPRRADCQQPGADSR